MLNLFGQVIRSVTKSSAGYLPPKGDAESSYTPLQIPPQAPFASGDDDEEKKGGGGGGEEDAGGRTAVAHLESSAALKPHFRLRGKDGSSASRVEPHRATMFKPYPPKSPPQIPFTNRGTPHHPPGSNVKILNVETLTLSKDDDAKDTDFSSNNGVLSEHAPMKSAIGTLGGGVSTTPSPECSYHLHRQHVIGRGSYGQVYLATCSSSPSAGLASSRTKFAAKCVALRPSDAKQLHKLEEEVSVLRQVSGHPFIIKLVDVLASPSEILIITELGRGGDLFHLLTMHPRHGVTESYAAKTLTQMLTAVSFLHSRGICHRDLKLENWVMATPNAWSDIKLIDFGLSTHYAVGETMTRVVGSSYYCAPQVLMRSYTELCDLWSLGVIAYMLLSGAPPFCGPDDSQIKQSILVGSFSFGERLFSDVSEDAQEFVRKLLAYDEKERVSAAVAINDPWIKRAWNS